MRQVRPTPVNIVVSFVLSLGFVGSASANDLDSIFPYSAEAFLEAFKGFCTPDLSSIDRSRERATAAGWLPAKSTDSPYLSRIIAKSEAASASASVAAVRFEIFVRRKNKKTYFGVLSGILVQGRKAHGCYVYDFEDDFGVPSAFIDYWLDEAAGKQSYHGGIRSETWLNPKRLPGYLTVRNMFVAKGNPEAEAMGLVGVALSTTQLVPDR